MDEYLLTLYDLVYVSMVFSVFFFKELVMIFLRDLGSSVEGLMVSILCVLLMIL